MKQFYTMLIHSGLRLVIHNEITEEKKEEIERSLLSDGWMKRTDGHFKRTLQHEHEPKKFIGIKQNIRFFPSYCIP